MYGREESLRVRKGKGKKGKLTFGRARIGSCVPTMVGKNSNPGSGNYYLWILQESYRSLSLSTSKGSGSGHRSK